jgi:hypothetical protein
MTPTKIFISTSFFFLCLTGSPLSAEVLQIDSDFEGKLYQWHHKSKHGKIIKIEYDKNSDGTVDQVDKYDGNAKPIKVKLDRDFVGTLDQIQHYDKQFNLTHTKKKSRNSGLIV